MTHFTTFLLVLFLSILIIINISYYESYTERRLLVNTENCDNIPKLNDDPLTTVPPISRYIPLTNNEQLASIYTWWNILDRTM